MPQSGIDDMPDEELSSEASPVEKLCNQDGKPYFFSVYHTGPKRNIGTDASEAVHNKGYLVLKGGIKSALGVLPDTPPQIIFDWIREQEKVTQFEYDDRRGTIFVLAGEIPAFVGRKGSRIKLLEQITHLRLHAAEDPYSAAFSTASKEMSEHYEKAGSLPEKSFQDHFFEDYEQGKKMGFDFLLTHFMYCHRALFGCETMKDVSSLSRKLYDDLLHLSCAVRGIYEKRAKKHNVSVPRSSFSDRLEDDRHEETISVSDVMAGFEYMLEYSAEKQIALRDVASQMDAFCLWAKTREQEMPFKVEQQRRSLHAPLPEVHAGLGSGFEDIFPDKSRTYYRLLYHIASKKKIPSQRLIGREYLEAALAFCDEDVERMIATVQRNSTFDRLEHFSEHEKRRAVEAAIIQLLDPVDLDSFCDGGYKTTRYSGDALRDAIVRSAFLEYDSGADPKRKEGEYIGLLARRTGASLREQSDFDALSPKRVAIDSTAIRCLSIVCADSRFYAKKIEKTLAEIACLSEPLFPLLLPSEKGGAKRKTTTIRDIAERKEITENIYARLPQAQERLRQFSKKHTTISVAEAAAAQEEAWKYIVSIMEVLNSIEELEKLMN